MVEAIEIYSTEFNPATKRARVTQVVRLVTETIFVECRQYAPELATRAGLVVARIV